MQHGAGGVQPGNEPGPPERGGTIRIARKAVAAGLLAAVTGVLALATGAVEAGCCSPASKGAVYSKGQTDEKACDNTYGKLTSREECEASVGAGKVIVID